MVPPRPSLRPRHPAPGRGRAVTPLAPGGTLRAAINFGNPVLAQRGTGGEPGGVTIALATELARRLAVPLSIVAFDQAGKVTDALPEDRYDVCFLARDPSAARASPSPNPTSSSKAATPSTTPRPSTPSRQSTPKARTSPSSRQRLRPLPHPHHPTRHPNPTRRQRSRTAAFIAGPIPVLAGVNPPSPPSSPAPPASACSPAASCPSSKPWAPRNATARKLPPHSKPSSPR